MHSGLIDEFHRIKDRHWWYRGRRAVLAAIVHRHVRVASSGRVLDVGSGPATNVDLLRPISQHIVALDIERQALSRCADAGFWGSVAGSAAKMPFGDGTFSLIAALDVVEHVDDDREAMREIARTLHPSGFGMIVVPAFAALWGWQDVVSGHKRRYRPAQVRALVEASGLQVVKITCMNFLLALPVLAARRLLRLSGRTPRSENTLTPRWLDPILYALFAAEAPFAARFTLPYGTSVVCIVRRNLETAPTSARHAR